MLFFNNLPSSMGQLPLGAGCLFSLKILPKIPFPNFHCLHHASLSFLLASNKMPSTAFTAFKPQRGPLFNLEHLNKTM